MTVLTYSADGEWRVSGNNQEVQVRRVTDSKRVATLGVKGSVQCLAVSSRYVAAGTSHGAFVWEAKTYKHICTLQDGDIVNGIDFSPDSTQLVAATSSYWGFSGTVTIWDVATGQQVVGQLHRSGPVTAAKYSPRGDRIAIGTQHFAGVYDSKNGHRLAGIPVGVTSRYNSGLLWLKEQLFVLSGSEIKQIEPSTGLAVAEWPVSHSNLYSCIAVPQHGQFIACSTKFTVSFWDTSTCTQFGVVHHTRDIHSIALSPDNRFLAIGANDGKITIKSLSHISLSASGLENLGITNRQLVCEALYAAGRIEDASEALFKMLHAFDKEVYTSKPIVNWVSDFTRQYLVTLNYSNMASETAQHDQLAVFLSSFNSSTPPPLLTVWVKSTLASVSWKEALLVAVDFIFPRFTVYRAACEYLESTDRISDAGECFCQMADELAEQINAYDGWGEWVLDFKRRCLGKLEGRGDTAMGAQRYDDAISYYSVELLFHPSAPDLFIKRSRARMAKALWEDALNDANEAIALDPSSPLGYQTKHAALYGAGRYDDAVEAFDTILSKITQSPDPQIREYCDRYIIQSRVRALIRKIIQRTIRHSPRMLINTTTGRLYDKAEQMSAFESLPIFNELVLSMTTRIDRGRIKRIVRRYFRYVMLSHKWEENEPLFHHIIHVSVYDLDQSPTHDKLKVFCKIARDAGFNWAWSDTCCINKQDHFVLQEALVAMFKWYRGSVLMIVFLRGVHSLAKLGALMKSVWNTRAWTFQEYVAAKVIQFYTEDWTPYLNLEIFNHKETPEIVSEMALAVGISSEQLTALRPGLNSIREKLRLASARQTTLVEDVAYSLLGIFSVTGIPAIYGEGESALGRLLAHVLAGSGDTSILAWTGQSSSYNSCLPTHINVFSKPATSHLPLLIEESELDRIVAGLRTSSIDLDSAVKLYDRLNDLSPPWFAASRMKLPCFAFKIPPPSPSRKGLYREDIPAFGMVEIRTKQDLSRLKSLYLVHPWLDTLLDREEMQSGAFGEDVVDELSSSDGEDDDISEGEMEGDPVEPPSWTTDDEDTSDEEGEDDSFGPSEPPSPTTHTRMDTLPLDEETRALRLVARLRQPFGALLFTLKSTKGRKVGYKRVASDSLITVQIRENVSLDEIFDNVRLLDVL